MGVSRTKSLGEGRVVFTSWLKGAFDFYFNFVFQLSQQNKEMATLLKPSPPSDLEEISNDGALEYFAKHTAQIEVKTLLYDIKLSVLQDVFSSSV